MIFIPTYRTFHPPKYFWFHSIALFQSYSDPMPFTRTIAWNWTYREDAEVEEAYSSSTVLDWGYGLHICTANQTRWRRLLNHVSHVAYWMGFEYMVHQLPPSMYQVHPKTTATAGEDLRLIRAQVNRTATHIYIDQNRRTQMEHTLKALLWWSQPVSIIRMSEYVSDC